MRKGKRIIALMVAAALLSTIPFGIFTADEPSSFDMYENDINMPEQDTDIYEQYKYIDISDNLQDNRSNDQSDYYDKVKDHVSYKVNVNAVNHWGYNGPAIYFGDGTKTIRQLSDETALKLVADGNESFSDVSYDTNKVPHIWNNHGSQYAACYIVENQNGAYIITKVIPRTKDGTNPSNSWRIPPKDGFILVDEYAPSHGIQNWNIMMEESYTVGTEVKLNFDLSDIDTYYLGMANNNMAAGWVYLYDEVEPNEKGVRNNNLQTLDYASTLDKVNINLFDYDNTINDIWKENNEMPGFNNPRPTEASASSNGWSWASMGDIVVKDLSNDGIVANKGQINKTSGNTPFIVVNGQAIDNRISSEGYPQLKDGTSLSYLFNDGGAVSKVNQQNIDGLFQYDEETHTYYFNSRENIAIYNDETNLFELYDGMLTPNYTTYVFGNFLPFANIQAAKKVSEIDRSYMVDLLESASYKAKHETDPEIKKMYQTQFDFLFFYITVADKKFGNKNWTYLDSMNDVFKTLGFHKDENGNFVPLTEDDLDFSKLYNIDFDDEKNFWFGMSQEVNFYQPENGMVGENNQYEMVYKFTGDDDFWLYIDGDLFIDLTGLHRHHGAEINFNKGTVSYYQTDVNNKGDLIEEPVLVKTFSEIVSDQSKLNEDGTFKDVSDFMNENRTDFLPGYDEETVMKECSHNLKLFYMERGSGSGVCRMNFNFPIIETDFNDANINLHIEKEISSNDSSFDKIMLDEGKEYIFGISLKEIITVGDNEMLSGKEIKGTISNKTGLTINNIPAGKYIIAEENEPYFNFLDLYVPDDTDAIRLTQVDDKYILNIDSTKITPDGTYYLKFINTPVDDRYYDDMNKVLNYFKP